MAHQYPMGDALDLDSPHSWTSSFPGATLILLQAKHLQWKACSLCLYTPCKELFKGTFCPLMDCQYASLLPSPSCYIQEHICKKAYSFK